MADSYSYEELKRMQEDAINQAYEMQKRAVRSNDIPEKEAPKQESRPQGTPYRQSRSPQNAAQRGNPPYSQRRTPFSPANRQSCNPRGGNAQNARRNFDGGQNGRFNGSNTADRGSSNAQSQAGAYSRQNTAGAQSSQQSAQQQSSLLSPLYKLFGQGGASSGLFGKDGFSLEKILNTLGGGEGGDQVLIIALLILLSNEDADKILLLALLYIAID